MAARMRRDGGVDARHAPKGPAMGRKGMPLAGSGANPGDMTAWHGNGDGNGGYLRFVRAAEADPTYETFPHVVVSASRRTSRLQSSAPVRSGPFLERAVHVSTPSGGTTGHDSDGSFLDRGGPRPRSVLPCGVPGASLVTAQDEIRGSR